MAFISAFLCGCCDCVTSLRAQWKPSDTNDTNDPNAYNFDSSVHDDGRMSRQLPRHPVVPRSHPFPSTFGLARPLSSARLPAHGLGTRLEVSREIWSKQRLFSSLLIVSLSLSLSLRNSLLHPFNVTLYFLLTPLPSLSGGSGG